MVDTTTIYKGASGDFLSVKSTEEKGLWEKPLTIKDVRVHTFDPEGAAQQKVILDFEEIEDSLTLNATNNYILGEAFESTETNNWIGRRIELRKVKRTYSKQLVDAIEVRALGDAAPAEETKPEETQSSL